MITKYYIKEFEFSERDKWKAYIYFPSDTLFLDIETEGISKELNEITLIGIYKQGKYIPFIKDMNLEKALKYLDTTPIWVTFGGENFDLPFIKKKFPFLEMPMIHLDLFFLTRKIGLKGGLKKIEKQLGINRKTDGMNGYHAVKLWRKWTRFKDKEALRKLILYNKEDVKNLKKILDYVINKLLFEEERNEKESHEGIIKI